MRKFLFLIVSLFNNERSFIIGVFMKKPTYSIGFRSVFALSFGRILTTWLILIVENILIALIPLFIGLSIDGLLDGSIVSIISLGGILVLLGSVAVARRIYDTRVYGGLRVRLGMKVHGHVSQLDHSAITARLDMSREIIDFLELELPELMTAIIQVGVSLVVLSAFDFYLGISCLLVIAAMVGFYGLFHRRFYRLNGTLNTQQEYQVSALKTGIRGALFKHLKALRRTEIALSDTEAFVYGGIFVLQIGFILFNLYWGATITGVSAGQIFSIIAYSWDYVEAALAIPIAMQSWSRLSEIISRLNR